MLYNNKRRQQENYTENVSISDECNVAGGTELHSSLRASFKGLKLPLGVEILKPEMEKS